MKNKSLFASFIFFVIVAIGAAGAYVVYNPADKTASIAIGICAFILALLISTAIKIADPWEQSRRLAPGPFPIAPGTWLVPSSVDCSASG